MMKHLTKQKIKNIEYKVNIQLESNYKADENMD